MPRPALETTILIFLILKNLFELELWGLGGAGATDGQSVFNSQTVWESAVTHVRGILCSPFLTNIFPILQTLRRQSFRTNFNMNSFDYTLIYLITSHMVSFYSCYKWYCDEHKDSSYFGSFLSLKCHRKLVTQKAWLFLKLLIPKWPRQFIFPVRM